MQFKNKKGVLALLLSAAVPGLLVPQASAALVDLTTAGASGTINNAQFQQVPDQSTGTGVIDSFVRMQANGNEKGYNTSGSPVPFDDKSGTFTHDLLLSDVPIVNRGGDNYYAFLLDINQVSSGDSDLLSLNQVQIFQTSQGSQTGGSVDSSGRLSGLMSATQVYDMNPSGPTDNSVLLKFSLNPGSGAGDMFLYVPTGNFTGGGQYVVLYSQFGNPPGTYGSNDGYEEWATVKGGTPIPEASTVIAGALLLLPFGASALRVLRRKSAV